MSFLCYMFLMMHQMLYDALERSKADRIRCCVIPILTCSAALKRYFRTYNPSSTWSNAGEYKG